MVDTAAGVSLRDMANALRALAMDAVEAANSGHPGMPMGMADVASVLFGEYLKFDPEAPDWPDRDRFILSAGHGSMLLYGLLHLTGYKDMTLKELRNFRQLGSKTPGHPEYGCAAGVETTTGPLGQGLANAVGMALAERSLNAEFGDDLVDHRTWVIAGDGCLMEGVSQEAITLAGRLKLSKLIVIWDDNQISIDGPVALADATDQAKRFEAAGWATLAADAHDPDSIRRALSAALKSERPVMIAARSKIGYGAPTKAGTAGVHGNPLGADEIAGARKALNWPHPPFEIPEAIVDAWRAVGARGAELREAWQARLADAEPKTREEFERRLDRRLSDAAKSALAAHAAKMADEAPAMQTRAASGAALDAIGPHAPELLGGSADLTGSNNTKRKDSKILSAEDYSGDYVHYGVREHGMASAMNGIALHKGLRPYGGTFLVFSDYSRPAIRLAALMGAPVIHVLTHDSIGLGEDGPTHQPVEHVAALRAIPNLEVFRPCDAVETAECWALALDRLDGPSALALSRQKTPALRTEPSADNLCAPGAYELLPAEGGPAKVSIFATGTEVAIAAVARAKLQSGGTPTRVVSVPCLDRFKALTPAEQEAILSPAPAAQSAADSKRGAEPGSAPVRVVVEAGINQGWDGVLRPGDAFVGMSGFGESAPAEDLYKHFDITPERVVREARDRL
ncbi:MAG: transketolase [Maricaulaceae bacterium]|jgi:transketolase